MPVPLNVPDIKLRWVIIFLLALAAFAGLRLLDVAARLKGLLIWIDSEWLWGPVVFLLLYILDCLLFIPGPTLIFGAGILFGVVQGTALVSFGATLAATIAYFIGRFLARDWVSRKVEANQKWKLILQAVAREGWKLIALTRLSPFFPFKMMNYAYGTTPVALKDYIFGTWLGVLPGTVTYVYLGSLIGSIFDLGSARTVRPGGWPVYVAGFMAAAAVTAYTVHRAKRLMTEAVRS